MDVCGLGGELKPFQRAGARYLLAQRRALLADEQGLGKTIEALATLEADSCLSGGRRRPASLKLNWLRELGRWLPDRSVQTLVGTGLARPNAGRSYPGADAEITVVDYDIVAARLGELRGLEPGRSSSTSPITARTPPPSGRGRFNSSAAVVPNDGLVLALTGTPVMNRPAELISQLRILGRLGDFGSGAQFGKRFRGPRCPPAPALASSLALLRASPEGRRAAAATGEDGARSCRSSSTTSPSIDSPSAI